MFRKVVMALVLLAGALGVAGVSEKAEAANLTGRQYYDRSWTYNYTTQHYYRKYYYQTAPTVTTYSYHYTIYYPTRPTYVYYYNPYKSVYWGRYEVAEGKGKGYSLLEEKDRKEKLTDIKEEAFPKPGDMPTIPESSDNVKMQTPPIDDLPKEAPKKQ
jgi:hypothetical protein